MSGGVYGSVREIDITVVVDGTGVGTTNFEFLGELDTIVLEPPTGTATINWEIYDRNGKGIIGDTGDVIPCTIPLERRLCNGKATLKIEASAGTYTGRLRGIFTL